MRTAIHEMRNHLCIAMSGIEALLDRKLEFNDARLRAIFAALREVNLLIDDLPRDRSVRFETHMHSIDVCALVGLQAAAMEGLAARRGVRLAVDGCTAVHAERPPFLGDPVRIAQIVTNVLMNAIRYAPSNSEVQVAYRRVGTVLRLRVSDDGPGIEPAERARIFEDGYRGRSVPFPPGSGIGLALVKQFVERHGGTIVISDGPLSGATFDVELPGTRTALDPPPPHNVQLSSIPAPVARAAYANRRLRAARSRPQTAAPSARV